MADENEFIRTSKPLLGVVLCCTSISADLRAEIHIRSEEMGAIMKQDLTSDVTHLCVGNTNTPKYKYVATQRPDVKVVMAEFIDSIREIWLRGEDVSIHDLDEEYRLPAFHGLKICVTNLAEDIRNEVAEIVQKNGGHYFGDLTKDITHLVVGETAGKKYQFAQSWAIKCVSTEWLFQSQERQMALDERFFNPEWPVEKRGKGAWIRPNLKKRKSSGPELQANEPEKPSVAEFNRRKIRRTASQRLSSQSRNIWGDIMGQANAPKPAKKDEWAESAKLPTSKHHSVDLIGNVDQAANTLKNDASKGNKTKLHFDQEDAQNQRVSDVIDGMFEGKGFYVHGFEGKKLVVLRGLLGSHDGQVFPSFESLLEATSLSKRLVVVPETTRQAELLEMKHASVPVEIVSNWWLEKCMHDKMYIEPSEYLLAKPFKKTYLEEFKPLTVSISRFDGVDFLHAHKAISLLGAKWYDQLSQKRNLLVVKTPYNSDKTDKIEAALEWGIPIVSAQWLYDCVIEAECLPYKRYLIAGSVSQKRSTSPETEVSKAKENEKGNLAKTIVQSNKKQSGSHALQGCVLFISATLKERHSKLESVISSLGGIIANSLDNNVPITHVLHQSKIPLGNTTELKIAKTLNECHVVTARWLQECLKLNSRAEEKNFQCEMLPQDTTTTIPSDVSSLNKDKNEKRIPVKGDNTEPVRPEGKAVGPFFIDDDNTDDIHAAVLAAVDSCVDSDITSRRHSTDDDASKSMVGDSFSVLTDMEAFESVPRLPDRQPDMLPPPPPPPVIAIIDHAKTDEQIKDIIALRRDPHINQPRKKSKGPLRGRAPSNVSMSRSLSRTNSGQSSLSLENDSLNNNNNILYDPDLAADRSKVYDDSTIDLDAVASQLIHYADPTADLEKRKILDKLSLKADDLMPKGRSVSMTTAAVEDLSPLEGKRRMTRSRDAKRVH